MKQISVVESVKTIIGSNFFYTGIELGSNRFKDSLAIECGPHTRDLRMKQTRRGKPMLVSGDGMDSDGMWVMRFNTQDVVVGKNWPGSGRVLASKSCSKNIRTIASGRHANNINSESADDLVAMIEPETMVVVKKVSQASDYYWFGDGQAMQFHPLHRPDILARAKVNLTTSGRIRFQDMVPVYTLRLRGLK